MKIVLASVDFLQFFAHRRPILVTTAESASLADPLMAVRLAGIGFSDDQSSLSVLKLGLHSVDLVLS